MQDYNKYVEKFWVDDVANNVKSKTNVILKDINKEMSKMESAYNSAVRVYNSTKCTYESYRNQINRKVVVLKND